MENFLKKNEPHCYALLRMVTGFLFLFHGTRWWLGWPGTTIPFEGPWHLIYIGAPILIFGGLFTCIGLFTRWAAFLSSGLMACAYWGYYGKKAFAVPEGSADSMMMMMIPYVNKGELSVMFCFAFLYIAARGSGVWSIDAKRGKAD